MAETIKQASDFSALHQLVETEIKPIVGIGNLAVYDIAHRIGSYFGKPPTLVYLHSGTAVGAAALGLRGKAIGPKSLPPAFSLDSRQQKSKIAYASIKWS